MTYLLDSGIPIRLMHPTDPKHDAIGQAIAVLRSSGISFACGVQNVAEFWNISTRPLTARGAFGLPLAEVERRLVAIERSVRIIPESDASYTPSGNGWSFDMPSLVSKCTTRDSSP